ncbi:addiction module protein [Prosthecobacter sp.]|jgi:putative addiction module component (TIGR02574 family)|uniref:addiction module protein n=1 Tax=Prosthecobacter sp. TaxID=1965333 RepID=UPI0037C6002A
MIATLDTVLAEALALPEDSRLQLVESLIPTLQITPDLEAEQINEVRRRIDEVRRGQVSTIPGEQVFREIRQSLAERRSA